ncbi:farnesyl pyrophosphate synthase-like [Phlebotomus argentipes]|uniref:farnesyl pyrophosphate synthase-like n=1 Tax=Phlebotomus argentipes TaxID=94469 RepID=UPI00289329C6|nr:farnesyl pyrophosphate synthase-like [Phlebotomus argentipes]
MLLSQKTLNDFLAYYPEIADELEAKAATIDGTGSGKHLRRVLDYVSEGGKKYGGIMVTETCKMLTPNLTPEKLKQAYYLGWAVEVLFDGINMCDDILDGGHTRRNKTCWYRLEDVKMSAVNDSCLLQTAAFYLLRKHFGHLECFPRLLDIVNETMFITYMGQHLEISSAHNFKKMTIKNYEAIAARISSNIIGFFPVAMGMTLAGYKDSELGKARSILTELGYIVLIENDFLDCFGDPKITGKVGRDIQEGKCRWMAIACLEHATPAQKEIMLAHYGRDTPEDEAIIKQLYLDVKVPEIYAAYFKEVYNRMMKNVEENSYGDLKKVYLKLINDLTVSTAAGGFYS